MEENLDVPQPLCIYARDGGRCFALSFAFVFATNERSQKLSVETHCLVTQTIVRSRWTISSEELLGKPMREQTFTNILLSDQ